MSWMEFNSCIYHNNSVSMWNHTFPNCCSVTPVFAGQDEYIMYQELCATNCNEQYRMRSVYPTDAERTQRMVMQRMPIVCLYSVLRPGTCSTEPADPYFTKIPWTVNLSRPVPLALWVPVPVPVPACVPRILTAKRRGSSLPIKKPAMDPRSGPRRSANLCPFPNIPFLWMYWLIASWFMSYLCRWTERRYWIRSLWYEQNDDGAILAAAVTQLTEKRYVYCRCTMHARCNFGRLASSKLNGRLVCMLR